MIVYSKALVSKTVPCGCWGGVSERLALQQIYFFAQGSTFGENLKRDLIEAELLSVLCDSSADTVIMQNKVVYGLYFALKSIDLDQHVSKIFATKTAHKNTK